MVLLRRSHSNPLQLKRRFSLFEQQNTLFPKYWDNKLNCLDLSMTSNPYMWWSIHKGTRIWACYLCGRYIQIPSSLLEFHESEEHIHITTRMTQFFSKIFFLWVKLFLLSRWHHLVSQTLNFLNLQGNYQYSMLIQTHFCQDRGWGN